MTPTEVDVRVQLADTRARLASLEAAAIDTRSQLKDEIRELKNDIGSIRSDIATLRKHDAQLDGKETGIAWVWHVVTAAVTFLLTWLGLKTGVGPETIQK